MLAAAGAKGTIGPNLDDAFAGSKKQDFKLSTIENVVLDQIREASLPMPKNLVKGQDAIDVAAYVAAVAATEREAAARSSAPTGSRSSSELRELPHAEGGGRDGHDRPEPRPAQAGVPDRRAPGRGRRRRHAGLQGQALPAQIAAVAKFVARPPANSAV